MCFLSITKYVDTSHTTQKICVHRSVCVVSLNIRVPTDLTYKQIYKNLFCAFFPLFPIKGSRTFWRGRFGVAVMAWPF